MMAEGWKNKLYFGDNLGNKRGQVLQSNKFHDSQFSWSDHYALNILELGIVNATIIRAVRQVG